MINLPDLSIDRNAICSASLKLRGMTSFHSVLQLLSKDSWDFVKISRNVELYQTPKEAQLTYWKTVKRCDELTAIGAQDDIEKLQENIWDAEEKIKELSNGKDKQAAS